MTKKRKIWDIIKEMSEHESGIDYHRNEIYKLIEELKGRRLTIEQEEEILYHFDLEVADALGITLDR